MADRPAAPEAAFREAWARSPPGAVVLAVSGGGDSMALMHLAAGTGARPPVVTVDHGLRPDSAAEAEAVARAARRLGLEHATLRWEEGPGGNLQAAARAARYRLIAEWAADRGIATIVTAHTLDDQAETVLMRLMRGSGVDGLAAMRETSVRDGVTLFRPLLGLGRDGLRTWLAGQGIAWHDDPSNEDPRFDRVRVRRAIAALGLDPARLAATAAHMARAADALDAVLDTWSATHVAMPPTGEATIDAVAFAGLHPELRLRLMARLLQRTGGQVYRPRFDALDPLVAGVTDPGFPGASLHGCLVRRAAGRIAVLREPAAVAPPVPLPADGAEWDGRWRVQPLQHPGDATLGALGEAGLAALPKAFREGLDPVTRLVALTTPAVWREGTLVAAPAVAPDPAWPVTFIPRAASRDRTSGSQSCP